jgi:hypothetical protein
MASAMEMSSESVKQYTLKMRERYSRMTGRQAKGLLLDEFIEVTGHERKYAIKVLGGSRGPSSKTSRRGRKPRFGPAVDKALKTLWQEMDQPCGKRMRDMLPLWVGHMRGIRQKTRDSLLEMSPATIDRKLRDYKVGTSRKIRPPRSESVIKAQVEIRAESWDVDEPGWTEIDTVAHCGGDMSGNFIWTLTCVDIATGWTEVRPVWNRGQYTTLQGLEQIRAALPFDLLGIDSDNGGEFLNHHLFNWAKTEEIKQTRSRPYRKNDQAHVEQKNFTHVRQLLGYDRLEHPELVEPLTELLTRWSLWKNLYHATMEQTSKRREGSRQIRTHAKRNRTPAQRLLESEHLRPKERQDLEHYLETTNPFEMKAEIEDRLEKLWKESESRNREADEKRQEPEEAHESGLAPEGRTPLRSVQPSGASERTTNQLAMVSR